MELNFVNVKDAAAELGLSPRAVQRRITNGTISAQKISEGRTSAWVITPAEIARVKALLEQPAA